MNAIWSFWSKPFREYYHSVWLTQRLHAMSWALSLMVARPHFATTSLCTDDDGAEFLIEKLGLKFDHVTTGLNAIAHCNSRWFGLGKLHAYLEQQAPFLHLDNDVFIWKPLPTRATQSSVVAQCWEPFFPGDICYRVELLEHALRRFGGVVPRAIEHYVPGPNGFRAVNAGILGGTDVRFLRQYADIAIDLIDNPRNQSTWDAIGVDTLDSVMVEQFTLAACLEARPSQSDALYVLFDTLQQAYQPEKAAHVGYTHLIGKCKKNPMIAAQVDELVRSYDPELHARCIATTVS